MLNSRWQVGQRDTDLGGTPPHHAGSASGPLSARVATAVHLARGCRLGTDLRLIRLWCGHQPRIHSVRPVLRLHVFLTTLPQLSAQALIGARHRRRLPRRRLHLHQQAVIPFFQWLLPDQAFAPGQRRVEGARALILQAVTAASRKRPRSR